MTFNQICINFQVSSGYSMLNTLNLKKGVPREGLKEIYIRIRDKLWYFQRGARYSCEDLCGKDIWGRYPSHGQHRAIGIFVRFLVKIDAVPFECVNPKQNNKLYTPKQAAPKASPSLSYPALAVNTKFVQVPGEITCQ